MLSCSYLTTNPETLVSVSARKKVYMNFKKTFLWNKSLLNEADCFYDEKDKIKWCRSHISNVKAVRMAESAVKLQTPTKIQCESLTYAQLSMCVAVRTSFCIAEQSGSR